MQGYLMLFVYCKVNSLSQSWYEVGAFVACCYCKVA